MEVIKVNPCGYCKGVVNAINLAKKTKLNNYNRDVYILGLLVHNEYVSKELAQLGIITLDDSATSKEALVDQIEDGIVIFTAHGISDKIKQKVIDKGLEYVDGTCVDVLKTQDIIKKYLKDGYDVLYFGKKFHPEAQAVLAISDKIHLVSNEEDLNNLKITNPKLFMTNQTTMSYLQFDELIEKTKQLYPNIIIQEEICDATSLRQKAIANLKDCDLLYVVGDPRSNNSNKLVEIGKQNGIRKAFLIRTYQDIDDDDLIDVNKVYVSAGASTPPYLIDEVIDYLRSKTL